MAEPAAHNRSGADSSPALSTNAPVAQWQEASALNPEQCGFESHRAYQPNGNQRLP